MSLYQKLAQSKLLPSFSFEFFPPKNTEASEALFGTILELESYGPSFVSVTYGAGGSTRDLTREVVLRLQRDTLVPTVPHLTCVGHTKAEITAMLEQYAAAGVESVLALRGDRPHNDPHYDFAQSDFPHAADLVRHIRAFNDSGRHPNPRGFLVGVAGFPEGHPETPNRLLEMEYMRAKADAGADYISTQMFFDNHAFFDYKERCAVAGIHVPILAGIMPILSESGMQRMGALAGGTCFPAKLLKAINRAQGNADAVAQVGIQYASAQCADLLDAGVDGIHFYTLNQSRATREIYKNLGLDKVET